MEVTVKGRQLIGPCFMNNGEEERKEEKAQFEHLLTVTLRKRDNMHFPK